MRNTRSKQTSDNATRQLHHGARLRSLSRWLGVVLLAIAATTPISLHEGFAEEGPYSNESGAIDRECPWCNLEGITPAAPGSVSLQLPAQPESLPGTFAIVDSHHIVRDIAREPAAPRAPPLSHSA